jgi:hypothetical protein
LELLNIIITWQMGHCRFELAFKLWHKETIQVASPINYISLVKEKENIRVC